MPSTFSSSLRVELIGSGEAAGTWGNLTNNNLGNLIEAAISGATNLDVGPGDITLTALNGVPDQARSAVLIITGSPGITRVITIPNVEKPYTVKNRSNSTVEIKTSAGTALSIPTLAEAYIFCDGNNGITGRIITDGANAINSLPNPFNNAALTGVPTAPTAAFSTNTTQIATTAFVQTALQAVFPVGSVYINAAVTTSPATLFGFGTWVEIGAGRVLVGQDTGDASFDTLGATGGSKDAIVVAHTHTGSGTTGTTNIDHTHSFSGTTDSQGNHTHTINDPGHNHSGQVSRDFTNDQYQVFSMGRASSANNSGVLPASTNANFTGISINAAGDHTHTVSGTNSTAGGSHSHTFSFTTASEGSSGTNANLQPYVVVKMWQRTA